MNPLKTTVCIAALCSLGTAAMADVTAQQVWDDWKTNFESTGTTTLTTGTETTANGVLAVTDIAIDMRNDYQEVSTNLGTITFTEQGDGTVAVQMNDSFQVVLRSSDTDFTTVQISQTDDQQDFLMKLNITDLSVSDPIWDMGDPSRTLPRDPISIAFDMSGQIKMLFDLFDPSQAMAIEQADTPADLYALNLNSLLVSAAGASLTGSGAFTFDNDDLTTFNGLPRPLGDATFEIKGANALIDNLVSMGILPLDQASMGRMMLGMFARSVGDDQLQTKVEVNEQGHLIVNGQRML